MFSRIIVNSAKSLVRRSAFTPKQILNKNMFFFAENSVATLDKIEKSKQKLAKAISREIKYEEDDYQPDDTIHTFLKEHGFAFRDVEGDNNLELSKKVGNAHVSVWFQSRSPQFDQEEQEGEEQNAEKGKEEEQEQFGDQDFCDFTVYITQSTGKSLVFECTSFDSEINVNFVSVVTDVEAHKKAPRIDRVQGYSSDFTILDERLQTALMEYLKSYGVNEDLALFVEHVSQDKDRRLYLQWLKDVNRFIEN